MRDKFPLRGKMKVNRSLSSIVSICFLLVLGSSGVSAGTAPERNDGEQVISNIYPSRALWVWDSRPIIVDPVARAAFFKFIELPKQPGTPAMSRLFVGASWAVNPAATTLEKRAMKQFLMEAHERGIEVDLLAGDPSWARPDKHESVQSLLDRLAVWQREAWSEEGDYPPGATAFDGIQLDVEPYLLPEWPSQMMFDSFVGMAELAQNYLKTNPDLKLDYGLAIPIWLDKEQYNYLNEDLQAASDYVALMDYRDTAERIVRDAVGALEAAERLGTKVFVGVNTRLARGSDPLSTTFYDDGYRVMEVELAKAGDQLTTYKSFVGIAIHDYKWYVDLQE